MYSSSDVDHTRTRTYLRSTVMATSSISTATRPSGVGREIENFKKVFRDLRLHVDVGVRLHQARRTDTDARFSLLFEALDSLLPSVEELQQKLAEGAPKFDFIHPDGARVKANGYRSLLFLLRCCLLQLHLSLQDCAKKRGSVFYFPVDHISNITAYCRALQGLEMMTRQAVALLEASQAPDLFNEGEMCHALKRFACTQYMERDVFYGRCLGFQYPSSMKPVLKMIAIAMASYERWHRADKDDPIRQLLQSLWKGSKYWSNPSQMGLKLDTLTQNPSVYFTKAFWSIVEQDAVKAAMTLISQSVEINQYMEIPAKYLTLQGSKGEVTLSPPFSDIGYKPIPVLLLSYKWRTGQVRSQPSKKQPSPPSTGLIVHFHGGGYVAQSPKYHESYLRGWSKDLDVPIVSVDYSLAPDAPFPRAVDECVFAYAWFLQNMELLGTTGDQIVFVGDSAGGNFVLTASMKLKELGLRLPDRIISCYPTLNATSAVSPSRFMTLVDLILPLGVLMSCQQAYCGCVPSEEVLQMRTEARKKILKARGVYLPEPDARSPSSPAIIKRSPNPGRKVSKEGRSDKKSSSSAGDSTDGKDSVDIGKRTPPPRPPPPYSVASSNVVATATTNPPTRPPPPKPRQTPSSSSLPGGAATDLIQFDEGLPNGIGSQESQERDGEGEDSSNEHSPLLRTVDLQSYSKASEQTGGKGGGEGEEAGRDDVDWPGNRKNRTSASVEMSISHRRTTSITFHHRRQTDESDRLTPDEVEGLVQEILKSFEDPPVVRDPYMSPTLAPDELLTGLPPVHIVACTLDPLLDDSIAMAQRLKAVGQPVTLNVMENLPHGFLCIYSAGNDPDLQAAFKIILSYLQQALKGT